VQDAERAVVVLEQHDVIARVQVALLVLCDCERLPESSTGGRW
jgi:hypothetical protein